MALFVMDFSAFQEPRGVMRIIQLIFALCTFVIVLEYTGEINFNVDHQNYKYPFQYPFNLSYEQNDTTKNCTIRLNGYYASDPRFFVTVGMLAVLCSVALIILYIRTEHPYRNYKIWTMIDFCVTVLFAVLWLSSSAAWANSLTGIKSVLRNPIMMPEKCGTFVISGYASLNISVVLGFLNFFLWTTCLWFVYKETSWFQQSTMPEPISGV